MNFWAVFGSRGCKEKTPNCHKYATFWGGFLMFTKSKIISKFFKKYPSVRTEKLHKIKIKTIFFVTWKKNYELKIDYRLILE